MHYDQDIEAALQAKLPVEFRADIPVLAQVLTAARNGAPASIATKNLQEALRVLQGQTLSTQGGSITVGNVSGEGIAIGHGAQATVVRIYVPRTDDEKHAWRNRSNMLGKVRTYWIEGFLKQSLHKIALIELGMQYYPDALEHLWDMMVQSADRPRELVSPGTSIASVFDEFGGELLILGSPGSGKTTMLLELTRTLIERAQQDETLAIPVVFNLSSWALKRPPLADWLIDELNLRYDVPRKLAKAWIEKDQILPLLDGLDEVRQTDRDACIAAINHFRANHGMDGLVVCSRIADYETLTGKLRLKGAILLQALTEQQIEDALRRMGDKAENIRRALKLLQDGAKQYNDQASQQLMQTPLMLSITTLAYKDAESNSLPSPGESPLEQQRHLFATYVDRMFKRRGISEKFSPSQTKRWLSWLAVRMLERSQTIFYIEHMQPDFLVGKQQRIYIVWATLVLGFIGVLIGGVIGILFDEILSGLGGLIGGILGGLIFIDSYGTLWPFLNRYQHLLKGNKKRLKESIGKFWLKLFKYYISLLIFAVIMLTGILLIDMLTNRIIYKWMVNSHVLSVFDVLVNGFLGLGGLLFLVWVFYGIAFEAIFLVYSWLGNLAKEPEKNVFTINIVEELHWSWSGLVGGLVGLIFGSIGVILMVMLFIALGSFIFAPLLYEWGGAYALFAITYTVILLSFTLHGLQTALSGNEIESRTRPNQGIYRSVRSALMAGFASGVVGGSIGLLMGITGLLDFRNGLDSGWSFGLFVGLVMATANTLVGILKYGGRAVILHYTLRWMLFQSGSLPFRNLISFLDHASERVLLRKVGGGYIFVHRMLMEYFASLEAGGVSQS